MQELFKRNKNRHVVVSLESGDSVAGKVVEVDSDYVGIQRTRPGPEPKGQGVVENFYVRYPSIQYVAFKSGSAEIDEPKASD